MRRSPNTVRKSVNTRTWKPGSQVSHRLPGGGDNFFPGGAGGGAGGAAGGFNPNGAAAGGGSGEWGAFSAAPAAPMPAPAPAGGPLRSMCLDGSGSLPAARKTLESYLVEVQINAN